MHTGEAPGHGDAQGHAQDGDDDCEECFVELTELLYRIENVLSSKPVDAFLEKMLHLEFREVGEFYGFLPIAEEFY